MIVIRWLLWNSICGWTLPLFSLMGFVIVAESQGVCNETIDGCCTGYFRSFKNNRCEKCKLGHIGPNCTTTCPYPSYGERCQRTCDCSNEQCDVYTGCSGPNTQTKEPQEVCYETIDGCCTGYFRSFKNNRCEKCNPGYIGLNCTTACPYPSYGERCQKTCNCSIDTCGVSTGCSGPNTQTTGIHF